MMADALPPGSTIGILGGGQLGRMLALAAARLGLKSHIYSDEPNAPAFDVAAHSTVGSFDDEAALGAFAASVGVVTCEFENVPAHALEIAAKKAPVHPAARSFAVAQDRPGLMTQARVWIENRRSDEAVPVHVVPDPDNATRVMVVNGISVSGTVTARPAKQAWEYRSVVVSPGRDFMPALTALGNDSWEATGIQLTTPDGVALVFKRPR